LEDWKIEDWKIGRLKIGRLKIEALGWKITKFEDYKIEDYKIEDYKITRLKIESRSVGMEAGFCCKHNYCFNVVLPKNRDGSIAESTESVSVIAGGSGQNGL
jgi:hypothetical protein